MDLIDKFKREQLLRQIQQHLDSMTTRQLEMFLYELDTKDFQQDIEQAR